MKAMREIGSEFWDVPVAEENNGLFPETTQWFLSGRCALKAIINELGVARSISLPSWCCDSIIKPFVDAHYTIRFYSVMENGFAPAPEMDTEVLLLMDFFGYTSPSPDLSNYKGIVIRDVTHSIFSSKYFDADYYFGSLRKWCGLWTGGFAWTQDGHRVLMKDTEDYGYISLRKKAMQLKSGFSKGRGATDKEYLFFFDEAEKCLEKVGIVPAADRDVRLATKLDARMIRKRRRANAEILRSAFPNWLMFSKMKPSDTPMFVPIIVPDFKRDELRKYLIEQKIYCPVHWPVSEYHKLDKRMSQIYQNELSLVCDQRYTAKDMNRIVKNIKDFMER